MMFNEDTIRWLAQERIEQRLREGGTERLARPIRGRRHLKRFWRPTEQHLPERVTPPVPKPLPYQP